MDQHDSARRNGEAGPGQFSWWLKLLLTWGVAGLMAWAAMSGRVSSVEGKVEALKESLTVAQQRASEDRGELRLSTDRLTLEISKLRQDLQEERMQRVIDRSSDVHATFSHGKQFDK